MPTRLYQWWTVSKHVEQVTLIPGSPEFLDYVTVFFIFSISCIAQIVTVLWHLMILFGTPDITQVFKHTLVFEFRKKRRYIFSEYFPVVSKNSVGALHCIVSMEHLIEKISKYQIYKTKWGKGSVGQVLLVCHFCSVKCSSHFQSFFTDSDS